tara:strand:- start:683 stop:865 length:183 start_codon:yes stop_codon:yes gene_type:complete
MAKKSKGKVVNVPQIKDHDKPQIDIPKELNKEKKVKVNDIFEGINSKKSNKKVNKKVMKY